MLISFHLIGFGICYHWKAQVWVLDGVNPHINDAEYQVIGRIDIAW